MIASIHITGCSYPNPDDTSRQDILAACKEGDPVTLEREPTNPHDPNAVKVVTALGQIGYCPRLVAERIGDEELMGRWRIERLLGGTALKPTLGCMIAPATLPSEE